MSTHLQVPGQFPFPVWVVTPKVRAAVEEAIAITQAPPALVASSACAAASLAVQTKFDVKRLDGLISPCSLFFITFAESGERKTSVDRMLFDSFSKFEGDVSKLGGEQNGEKVDGAVMNETIAAKIRLLYSDTTPAAFLAGLHNNSQSAGLCEDEAGRIFASRLVDDLGLLNKLWDGRDVTVDRKHESYRVRAPRCTIAWMVQPAIYKKFMDRKGEDARGIGFIARCLVSYPLSTQGTRFLRTRPENLDAVNKFNDRVLELLNDQIDLLRPENKDLKHEKCVLSFSAPAQAEWERIFNNIEYSIQPGGAFCENRDYASKVAENIARLAGVFHAFEGYEGTKISVETLNSAATVVLWYAGEFVRLFTPPGPLDVINGYARLLDQWLIEFVKSTNQLLINKNDLLQLGPNKLRSRDIMNIAIQRLVETNRVFIGIDYQGMDGRPTRKGIHKLQLSDAYYGQIARGNQPWAFVPL